MFDARHHRSVIPKRSHRLSCLGTTSAYRLPVSTGGLVSEAVKMTSRPGALAVAPSARFDQIADPNSWSSGWTGSGQVRPNPPPVAKRNPMSALDIYSGKLGSTSGHKIVRLA